jgi:methylmalonyl-CoA/ethylmalonyl-CoA epimerase
VTELPIDILKMDHVAWATWDATAHVRMLTEMLGATFVDGGDDSRGGFRWLQFQLPSDKVEVIEPLTRESFLYKFLTKRGEGMHHLTFYVRDLATAVEQAKAAGYEPVDINLQSDFWKEAFLSPRETNGILIQLAQAPSDEPPNPDLRPLEEYLADRPNLRPD